MTVTRNYETLVSDNVARTTYTFTAVDLGLAANDKRVHLAIFGTDNSGAARTLSSVTIDGVSALINVQASNGAQQVVAAIATAHVPAATGDIVVTFSGNMGLGCEIGVWSSTGMSHQTANATGTSTADPGSITLATFADGFLIAMGCINTANTQTWTNAAARYDSAALVVNSSGADADGTGGNINPQTDYTIADVRRQMVAAAFGNSPMDGRGDTALGVFP